MRFPIINRLLLALGALLRIALPWCRADAPPAKFPPELVHFVPAKANPVFKAAVSWVTQILPYIEQHSAGAGDTADGSVRNYAYMYVCCGAVAATASEAADTAIWQSLWSYNRIENTVPPE